MLSRQGESLLAAAGLRDWIARDGDDYVRIAVERTADLPALARFRSGLRDRLTASALFDAKRFARELADAFVAMSAAHAPHQ
jgi:predicted O-linked N-acetylglucosamine transferase (SPINDLY family)